MSLNELVDGEYTRRVYAIDNVGLTGTLSDEWTFTVDTIKPTATVEYIPSGTGWTSGDIQAIVT